MNQDRRTALQYCAEAGFIIMPCAYHAQSTTQWFFDVYERNEEVSWFEKDGYMLRYLRIFKFFDAPEVEEIKALRPWVDFLNMLVDRVIARDASFFPIPEVEIPEMFSIYSSLEEAGEIGMDLYELMKKSSAILNRVDPLDWTSYKVSPAYLRDYMKYGFCLSEVKKITQD